MAFYLKTEEYVTSYEISFDEILEAFNSDDRISVFNGYLMLEEKEIQFIGFNYTKNMLHHFVLPFSDLYLPDDVDIKILTFNMDYNEETLYMNYI